MKILNVVIGEATGGRWQAFCDFGLALSLQDNEVIYLVRPDVPEAAELRSGGSKVLTLRCSGHYDLLATWKARKLLATEKPDAILTHCSRSLALMRRASGGRIPVVATLHNPKVKRMLGADGYFCITRKISDLVLGQMGGETQVPVKVVPNMVRIPEDWKFTPREYHSPPVIGVLARLVPYKGVDIFLQTLSLLKGKGIKFSAIIGGQGESEESLRNLARELDVAGEVEFRGWIQDKEAFFRDIDIFCLPSLTEPFGIVLLEAFLNSRPLVATDTDGPQEVCRDGHDALLALKGDAGSLSECLEKLLLDPQGAQQLARNGFDKVCREFAMHAVAETINENFRAVVLQFNRLNKT